MARIGSAYPQNVPQSTILKLPLTSLDVQNLSAGQEPPPNVSSSAYVIVFVIFGIFSSGVSSVPQPIRSGFFAQGSSGGAASVGATDVLVVLRTLLSVFNVVEVETFVVFVTTLPAVVKLLTVLDVVLEPSAFVVVVTGPVIEAGPVITGFGMSKSPPLPSISPTTEGLNGVEVR